MTITTLHPAEHPGGASDTSPGESLAVPERLLVAPMPGRFEPTTPPNGHVRPGQIVGAVALRRGQPEQIRREVLVPLRVGLSFGRNIEFPQHPFRQIYG